MDEARIAAESRSDPDSSRKPGALSLSNTPRFGPGKTAQRCHANLSVLTFDGLSTCFLGMKHFRGECVKVSRGRAGQSAQSRKVEYDHKTQYPLTPDMFGSYSRFLAPRLVCNESRRFRSRNRHGLCSVDPCRRDRALPPDRRMELQMAGRTNREILELLDSLAHGCTCPLREAKRAIVFWTLARTRGNVSKAANLLGASRGTVYRYSRDHGG